MDNIETINGVIKVLETTSGLVTPEQIEGLKMISQELDYLASEYSDMILLASSTLSTAEYAKAFESLKAVGAALADSKEPRFIPIHHSHLTNIYNVFSGVLPMMEKAEEIAAERHQSQDEESARIDAAMEKAKLMMASRDAKRHALALRQMAIFGRDAGKAVAETMIAAADFLHPEE